MKRLFLTCLALGLVLSTPPTAAANGRETFDQVIADAERVRVEAREVRAMLGSRGTALSLVVERTAALEGHVNTLKASIDRIDSSALTLTLAQQEALARARVATSALMAMLANKSSLLSDQQQAAKQRGLIRSKADAIAKRAEIVQKQMTVVRG